MHYNRLLIALTAVFLFSLTHAQESKIEHIRTLYAEAKEYVNNPEHFHDKTHIAYRRMIPALGSVETTIDFYGNEEYDNEEESTYPWYNDGKRVLKLVTVSISCACSTDAYIEYLFDPESQELIFCYLKKKYIKIAFRLYFKDNKLIRYSSNYISEDDTEYTINTTNKGFDREQMEQSKLMQSKAIKYLEMFDKLYSFEKLEKR